jgi:hypothetical protein
VEETGQVRVEEMIRKEQEDEMKRKEGKRKEELEGWRSTKGAKDIHSKGDKTQNNSFFTLSVYLMIWMQEPLTLLKPVKSNLTLTFLFL